MLRRALRASNLLKNVQPVRGGGGWPRPDVPLLENYEHKRQLSIYDINAWWYDNVMPEYALTFQDQHCHDHWTTLRIWGRLFIPLFAAMAAGAGFLYTVYSVRLGGFELEDEENAPFFNQLDRSAKERYGIRRSFLGMERTGEEGILYNSPDKPGPIKRVANDFKKSIQYKKQINTEAKNYVSRVESEVRAKFAKGTESHGEHH